MTLVEELRVLILLLGRRRLLGRRYHAVPTI